jgi:hypothetical protein
MRELKRPERCSCPGLARARPVSRRLLTVTVVTARAATASILATDVAGVNWLARSAYA